MLSPALYDDAERLRREFASARPFPHVVLEDVLVGDGSELVAAFPERDWDGWESRNDHHQPEKMSCSDATLLPAPLDSLIAELSQPRFLRFLEHVTGVSRLLVDPYLEGGGLHCSGPGGVLVPHTDFHVHPDLRVYRRLNVLLYLNPGWQESWGGNLDFFAPGAPYDPVTTVVPKLGTMVIFRTDDRSRHGFPQPVAEGRYRRSVALYYYTATEAAQYSGDRDTYWNRLPTKGFLARLRSLPYVAAYHSARFMAKAAHVLDPQRPRRSRRRTGMQAKE